MLLQRAESMRVGRLWSWCRTEGGFSCMISCNLSAWRHPVAVQHIHYIGNTSWYNAKHGNLISVEWNESSNSRSLYWQWTSLSVAVAVLWEGRYQSIGRVCFVLMVGYWSRLWISTLTGTVTRLAKSTHGTQTHRHTVTCSVAHVIAHFEHSISTGTIVSHRFWLRLVHIISWFDWQDILPRCMRGITAPPDHLISHCSGLDSGSGSMNCILCDDKSVKCDW